MALIEIKDLYKKYRIGNSIIKAIDGINLEIKKGEFIELLGTSGSGKSTLLNLLAGLETATKGSIKYRGIDITKKTEEQITKFRNLNIGFVFQSYNLLPNLTALENVSLPLVFKGMDRKTRNNYAKEILSRVNLADRMYNKPSELSGGQQQRVSIARAFVGNPKIIFADEPTGNLDTKTSFEVMELIKKIKTENNQTVIMVTHDDELTEFADRVLYMRDGKIEKVHEKVTREEILKNSQKG
ncbi:MAG: ABC transporter ATP-binding protein [Tissierellia bacterium]|nr:ABC transporter ATP-binding protein [Tissierellia bacterium]